MNEQKINYCCILKGMLDEAKAKSKLLRTSHESGQLSKEDYETRLGRLIGDIGEILRQLEIIKQI